MLLGVVVVFMLLLVPDGVVVEFMFVRVTPPLSAVPVVLVCACRGDARATSKIAAAVTRFMMCSFRCKLGPLRRTLPGRRRAPSRGRNACARQAPLGDGSGLHTRALGARSRRVEEPVRHGPLEPGVDDQHGSHVEGGV